jgi:hypothetical protein
MRRLEKTKYTSIFGLLCILIAGGYYLYAVSSKDSIIGIMSTNVKLLNDSLALGKFEYYSTKRVPFYLKNYGNQPLVISSVQTSCGCTVAKYIKRPIAQGETTTVLLEFKPNSLGYFSKTADVMCNVPEGYVRLKISGEVVEK